MLSNRQKKGMKANFSGADLADIQLMLDEAFGHFDSNEMTRAMIAAAATNATKKFVNLRDEGWHQLENYKGKQYMHIKVEYLGLEYHCYAEVTGAQDRPKSGSHIISQISYINFEAPKPYPVNVDRS